MAPLQGATTLGLSPADFLRQLKDAGLGSLPGTAAEVLDDQVGEGGAPGGRDTPARQCRQCRVALSVNQHSVVQTAITAHH
jgi:2-iminoacetate synthase ThiH